MTDAVKVYFDTNVFFNKFEDPYKISPETSNIFSKVKSGEFRLVISQSVLMEMFHVMCLPLEDITKFDEAQEAMTDITSAYNDIKETILRFPNTELAENEFTGISSTDFLLFWIYPLTIYHKMKCDLLPLILFLQHSQKQKILVLSLLSS